METAFLQPELTDEEIQKLTAIQGVLDNDSCDINCLRRFAMGTGGLLKDDVRKVVWRYLLQLNDHDIPQRPDDEALINHTDYRQVVLDVSRSLRRFPPGMEDTERLVLQDHMINLIMSVLVRHDDLHYYQGYHDICVTILLVVGEKLSFPLLDRLSTRHLRGFMDANMTKTRLMLCYLYPILSRADPELSAYMQKAEVGTIFALSWLITWFGHVLNDFRQIVRLYDFFIACHPLMPVYLAAAIVLYRKEEIYSTECEMCYIHSLLSHIPETLPLEYLIQRAGDLYIQSDPKLLTPEAESDFNALYNRSNERKTRLTQSTHRNSLYDRLFTYKLTAIALSGLAGALTLASWYSYSLYR